MISLITNEKQTLMCLIEKPELILQFEKNYFISGIGKDIFDILHYFYNNEKPIQPTINNIINEGNRKNEAITKDLIASLFKEEYTLEDFKYYQKRLKEDYIKNKFSDKTLKELLIVLEQKGDLDTNKLSLLVEELQIGMEELEDKKNNIQDGFNLLKDYQVILEKKQKGEYFYSTGDSYLDSYLIEGFMPGYITTLFSNTGVGKSMYALNLINKQINKYIPNLYVSLELGPITTAERLLSMRNRIPTTVFSGRNQNDDLKKLASNTVEKELVHFENYPYFAIIQKPSVSITELEHYIRIFKKRINVDYCVVVVDLLTMLSDFLGQGKAEIYENCMNRLHYLVRKENVHLFGIVQARRDNSGNKYSDIKSLNKLKPTLDTIKSSSAIAERSRIVLSAFRLKYYAEMFFPELPELDTMEDILEIAILKQSSGALANLKYLYQGETSNIFKYVESKECV